MNLKRGLFIGLILWMGTGLSAQETDTAFSKQWIEIDSLLGIKRLPKSALDKVNQVYKLAEERSNKVQQIKAMLYRISIENDIAETDITKKIATIQLELNKTNDPGTKALLHVFKAKQYQSYFNHHRWQLYDRSTIKNQQKPDILNWSADDFLNAIEAEYNIALSDKVWLKKTKLFAFRAILWKGNAEYLRPTLYDIIAQDALDYYKIGQETKTSPVNGYMIQQQEALGTYSAFASLKLSSSNSNAPSFKAIQLFQELTLFHINDEHKEALIHIDIDRINWVYEQVLFENKIQLKEKALTALTKDFKNEETANVWLQLARDKSDLAASYSPYQDSSQRWQYLASINLIDEAAKIFINKNPVKNELENLKQSILSKTIRIHTDQIDLPNKPFRALVQYKNVDTLFTRILELPLEFTKANNRAEILINQLCNKKILQSNKQWLPVTNDYQLHFVEIKLNPLPHGEYVLLTSTGRDFNPASDIINYQSFQVSNISLIQNKTDFFILNRETGKPISNAIITILSKSSNFQNKEWENEGTKITDENGYAKMRGQKNNRVYSFIIDNKNEKFRTFDPTWFESENNNLLDSNTFEKRNQKTFFFTDRSIYRPGQTVYFKALISTIDFNTQKSKLLSKTSSTVYLRDVNYRAIDSMKFTSNEFGSYQGKFILPEKTLTGNFSLTQKSGEIGIANFSVESYKRPTYSIHFEKIDKPYKLNDTILLKGFAKAFAGNFITGAKLTYHIIRNTRPLNPYPRFLIYRNNQPQEISQGTLQTDNNGAFTIQFKAIPDLTKDSSIKPVFDYVIDISVTDASGETRTANKQISCAYQSLILEINHPEISNGQREIKIGIATTSLSAEKVSSNVNIRLSELIGPDRLLKERNWPRPDQFIMSKEVYTKNFPYDIYNNENEISQFPIEKNILETSLDTWKNGEWKIEAGKLKAGYYQIEAIAKDSAGNWETSKSYMQVFDPSNNTMAKGNLNLFYASSSSIEPGERDTIYTGTDAKDLYIIRHLQTDNNKGSYQYVNRKKGIESFIYEATEKDRGGIHIEELIVFQNQLFINRYNKTVPFTNKELQINYKSFRDKTEPGSAEKWTVTVTGKKGEKVAAELLTSMYDASLDEFKIQQWNQPNWWNEKYQTDYWKYNFSANISEQNYITQYIWKEDTAIEYDRIRDNFGISQSYENDTKMVRPMMSMNSVASPASGKKQEEQNKEVHSRIAPLKQNSIESIETIIRKKFNETAFFFPQLYADSTGTYRFSFTMPDAVTKWKWMSFAHTKDLSSGIQTAEVQTQKTLMVQTNAPRFLREGDKMEFSTRIANMSEKELTGQITLELIDATTNTSIDGWFQNIFPTQYFTVDAKQTEAVKFPIQIPFSYNKPLIWRVVAKSGNYSDGEENILAVLSNRQLVTESLPILVNGDTTQYFHFDNLLNQNSSSLTHESLTVEFSNNPIWYAVQALPYLKQGLDNCAEAVFNKIYANSIAAYIVSKNPIIKTWYEQTKKDTASLLSNLQKNQQLKQVLLEETPWVLAANTETERKKNLSELFDLLKLGESTQSSFEKLQDLQLPNGAFSWFKGGYADPYITTYILTGIGRLKKLGALTPDMNIRFQPMLLKAIQFTDENINTEYKWMITHSNNLKVQHISGHQIQYLYMRSFFGDIAKNSNAASVFYTKQSKDYWNHFSVYYQSLIGLIQLRNKEEKFLANTLLPSIFENAVMDKQKGMYWKQSNWDWYSSPIETGAMVTELASEYNQQKKSVALTKKIDAIKTWLIINKQTNNWKTSIKTANACYALILNGSDWLKQQKTVQITLGNTIINSNDEKTEFGTGYFEKRIEASKIDSSLANITITTKSNKTVAQKNNQPAWGAIYWQYFEDQDKIKEAKSPLSIQKELMVENMTDKGKVLVPVDLNNPLKVGDKVVVRMVIKTDREMEYVHLKDMRAAGMEPVNVLSGYKWQDGLGYYENTTDISSNFFISHLNKGTYVFEYPVYITHIGNFSVGIASIQCMYAPEFNSHSEGIRINVAE